jgi:hypothetical protein
MVLDGSGRVAALADGDADNAKAVKLCAMPAASSTCWGPVTSRGRLPRDLWGQRTLPDDAACRPPSG